MMRQIRLLTKVSFYGMFGLNELRFTKDSRKKCKGCLMAILCGLLIVMMAGYVCALSFGMVLMGMGRYVPAVLTMCVSLLVFFFTIFKAGSVLFDRKAYEKQITMPVTVRAIIISRFLTMYITDMLLGLLVLLPGMAVYGVMEKPRLAFYLYGILAGVFLPLLPLTAASVLGALIAGVSSRWKRKNLVSIVLSLGLVCLIMAASMKLGSMGEGELESVLQEAASLLEGQISGFYPPALWIADAMVSGKAGGFVMFLAVSLGCFLLFLEILQRFYVNICMLLGAREARGNYRMKSLQEKSVLKSMVERELRHYFSSAAYVTNTLVGEIMMVLLAAVILAADMEKVEQMLGLPDMMGRVMPVLLGFFPVMSPITASSISMEGKQWWMMQTLPITKKDIVRGKVLMNLLVAFPFYLVSEILLLLAFKPGWAEAAALLAVPAVYHIFGARAGLAVNERFPVFDWENEVRVVKQSASVLVAMLLGVVTALVPLGILLAMPGIPAGWVYVATAVLLTAAVFVMERCTPVRI